MENTSISGRLQYCPIPSPLSAAVGKTLNYWQQYKAPQTKLQYCETVAAIANKELADKFVPDILFLLLFKQF
jgi:hypothetical protein